MLREFKFYKQYKTNIEIVVTYRTLSTTSQLELTSTWHEHDTTQQEADKTQLSPLSPKGLQRI